MSDHIVAAVSLPTQTSAKLCDNLVLNEVSNGGVSKSIVVRWKVVVGYVD
jgi:hypothetical protein